MNNVKASFMNKLLIMILVCVMALLSFPVKSYGVTDGSWENPYEASYVAVDNAYSVDRDNVRVDSTSDSIWIKLEALDSSYHGMAFCENKNTKCVTSVEFYDDNKNKLKDFYYDIDENTDPLVEDYYYRIDGYYLEIGKTYYVKATINGGSSAARLDFFSYPIEDESDFDISNMTVTLSSTSYTYNGGIKTPSVKVTDTSGNTLEKNMDYTVSYQSGRKYVGTYKVVIKGDGSYSGSVTKTFKINPQGTYITRLSKGSKRFTVKWKKKSTQITGYQVRYSTSSSMTGAKTTTITKYKTTYKTVKNLKAKKKYYVQVRTYKTVSGTKYYSGWSSKKAVKTR